MMQILRVVALSVVLAVSHAGAQLEAALGASSVGSVVEDIRGGLESTLNTGSARLNGNIIMAQGSVSALLNQLDLIAEARQGKLVRDLSVAEQNLFASAYSLMKSGQNWTATTTKDAGALVRNASNLILLLPGGRSTPILQETVPSYVARSGADAESFDLTFKGLNIGLSTPFMKLGGRDCKPKTVTNNEVTFDCPLIGLVEKPTVLDGQVSFFKTVSPWDKLKDFFFKDAPKLQTYVTRITVLPAVMGNVDAVMVVPRTRVERQVISDARSDQNEHCAGERRTDFLFVVPAGWKLDPAQQPVVAPDTRESSTYIGVTSRTDTSFTLSGTVKNSGQCIRVPVPFSGSKIIAYDARGKVSVGVQYTVMREVPENAEVPLPSQPLLWGKDVTISFPADATQMRVTVSQINGVQKTTVLSETIGWTEVLMDKANHTVILRPLTPDKALRQ
ncbi:hypothetical protein [Deinococcus marmoris]|uniref:hypothetical protein n=1 Tax=Deinococcus marmoris TaxID=249408 RepID=UPI0004953199|nr:hypothetical protein [Deinococcus marmoris]